MSKPTDSTRDAAAGGKAGASSSSSAAATTAATGGAAIHLPAVHLILSDAGCEPLIAEYGRVQTLEAARALLAELRVMLLAARKDSAAGETAAASASDTGIPALLALLTRRLRANNASPLRPVFNLTGTVLHTNLGRALLPDSAVQAVAEATATT
jgi:L-seryl-tRNA(Ser) seleniumtransferase